jgi:hypothetical protein
VKLEFSKHISAHFLLFGYFLLFGCIFGLNLLLEIHPVFDFLNPACNPFPIYLGKKKNTQVLERDETNEHLHLNTKYKKTLLTKVVAMGLSGKLLQIIVHGVIIFAIVAAATAATMAKPGCPNKCGGVDIPYPFGLSKDCYRDWSFSITCQSGKPMTGNLTVTGISIETHELQVLNWVGQACYKQDGIRNRSNGSWLQSPVFYISNRKNKFIVLGCDTIGYLSGNQNGEKYWTGCSSKCSSLTNVVNGSCSGVGCCELARFPDGLQNIAVEVNSYENHTQVLNFNPCGYAFVVEKGKFNFSTNYLKNLLNETFPLVLDWAVGNQTCEKAHNEQNFACKNNSDCLDHLKSRCGYQCKCKQGYNGNPYLDGGCQGAYGLYIHIESFPIEKVKEK